MNRREALHWLGLSTAALPVACGGQHAPLPDGEIVGPSEGMGHRLARGFRPMADEQSTRRVRVVVVGGGIAGLTAGWRLLRSGLRDFCILELESEPGGTSRYETSSVSSYPWAAHYVPVPQADNRALIRLLREMDVLEANDAHGEPSARENMLCSDPQERIYYKGRWYEGLYLRAGASPDDLRQLREFEQDVNRWVAWRDARGRRAFVLPTAMGSDDPEVRALDLLSMADYLNEHNWRSPRLRWLVEYACRDDYGLFLEDTSAWAGLFYFASRIPMPGEEAEPLLTWPEGNGRFVRHFESVLKAHLLPGQAVTDIHPGGDPARAEIMVTAFDRKARRPVAYRAQRVIFAAPQFLARHLVRTYRDHAPEFIQAFEYGPWLVANLTLRARPVNRGFSAAWDNVIYESPSLGYVVATHQTGRDHGPTVLTYYHAFCDSDAKASRSILLSEDWAHWAEIILSDLERAHPEIRRLTTRLDIMRWGHAMIRPKTGFIWSAARARAAQTFNGIHFAHTDLSGMALFEEAFYHGLRAAEEVLLATGRAPLERWI